MFFSVQPRLGGANDQTSASGRATTQFSSGLSPTSVLPNPLVGIKQGNPVEARIRREAGHQLAKEAIRARLQSYGPDGDEPFAEESLFAADLGEIYRQCRRWASCLPNVTPFYGISPTAPTLTPV